MLDKMKWTKNRNNSDGSQNDPQLFRAGLNVKLFQTFKIVKSAVF